MIMSSFGIKAMKTSISKTMAFLLVAGTIFCACNEIDINENPAIVNPVTKYTLTVKAAKGSATKALSIDGTTITSVWSENDAVDVYLGDTKKGTIYATGSGANTTLSGALDDIDGISESTELTLKYLSPSYSSQDGTLTGNDTSLDKVCDFATATVTVSSIAGTNITTTAASFVSQQAIVRFTLTDKNNSNAKFNAKNFTVKYGDNTIPFYNIPGEVYTKNGDGIIYVAIPAVSNTTVKLQAEASDGIWYEYERDNVSFNNSLYYPITVRMVSSYERTPLTLLATADGKITLTNYSRKGSLTGYKLYVKKNHEDAQSVDYGSSLEVSVENGDRVSFFGDGNVDHLCGGSESLATKISSTCNCKIYGNVMSMLSSSTADFSENVSLSSTFNFSYLFKNNTYIFNHETYPLLLPATSLQNSCYESMFCGCTHLTSTPNLPASELKANCYKGMFYGCSSITSSGDISATTLAERCCSQMFYNCSALVEGPDLLAKDISTYCYYQMFYGCTNLKPFTCKLEASASELSDNLDKWLKNVTTSGTFYCPSSMTSVWPRGNNGDVKGGIPTNWAPAEL